MSQKLRRQNLSEWQILKRRHERVLKYATLDIFPVNSTVIYDCRTFIRLTKTLTSVGTYCVA